MNLSQNNSTPISVSKIAIGTVLVLLGIVLLGFNMKLIPDHLWHYIMTWQLILIVTGIIMLLGRNSKMTGLILIIIGGIFYISKFTGYDFNFFKIAFPLIFIFIGLSIIFKRKQLSPRNKFLKNTSGYLDETAIFSGSEIIYTEELFQGGNITAIFGGYHLDLTKTNLPLGTTFLDITAVFGGVEIVVPEKWKVTIKTTSVFGAFEDKRHNKIVFDSERELAIIGTAVFGGGELKAH